MDSTFLGAIVYQRRYQFRTFSSVRVEPVEFTTDNLTPTPCSFVYLCQFEAGANCFQTGSTESYSWFIYQ